MSEQAFLTFRIDGRDIDTYVHDADGLAPRVQAFMHRTSPEVARAYARTLRPVDPASRPSESEQMALMRWADISVAGNSLEDWYCLLRLAQGDPDGILQSGVALTSSPAVRPFARWRFVLDLDAPGLEVWHRGPWLGGPVGEFQRIVALSWTSAPGADLETICEAAMMIAMADEEVGR